jgi:hypothetical protein
MWILVLAGVAGILFTIVLYGSLFYFGFIQRGGAYDKMRGQMAVSMLNGTVREIEFYKMTHGHYPTDLKEIASTDKQGMPVGIDPLLAFRIGSKSANNTYFYYELNSEGTHYFLRSVGPDGIPFTSDDILPSIPESERMKTGLLLRKEEANQSTDPTLSSGAPPAGQPARHP